MFQNVVLAVLFGTHCIEPHIVPVPVKMDHGSVFLDDVDLQMFVNISRLHPAWVNVEDRRHRFDSFAADEKIAPLTQFITCFEEQPATENNDVAVNQYVHFLKGGYGKTWYGNILVFKCVGYNRVKDVDVEDVSLAKRWVAMSVLFSFVFTQLISSFQINRI